MPRTPRNKPVKTKYILPTKSASRIQPHSPPSCRFSGQFTVQNCSTRPPLHPSSHVRIAALRSRDRDAEIDAILTRVKRTITRSKKVLIELRLPPELLPRESRPVFSVFSVTIKAFGISCTCPVTDPSQYQHCTSENTVSLSPADTAPISEILIGEFCLRQSCPSADSPPPTLARFRPSSARGRPVFKYLSQLPDSVPSPQSSRQPPGLGADQRAMRTPTSTIRFHSIGGLLLSTIQAGSVPLSSVTNSDH